MTGFDIAVAVVITLSALIGLWRGVIREVFALAAWVAAIICMFVFGEQLAQMLPFARDTTWLRMLAGYAIVFLGVFVTLSVVGFLFSKLVNVIGLSFVDRALGMLFGALRGGLIAVLLVFIGGATNLTTMNWWRDSMTAKPLATFAAILRSKLPDDLAKRFKFSATQTTLLRVPLKIVFGDAVLGAGRTATAMYGLVHEDCEYPHLPYLTTQCAPQTNF